MHNNTLTYSPHIDGLRTFAVMTVILEHFNIAGFSGGYIGVDVFFVISGYLISYILITKFSSNSFSFADFYERRCRRILPPLYAMLTIIVWMPVLMITSIFPREFYKSILATLSFISNIFFWRTGGYFDAPMAQKQLLHTWSLGVEEQFYIIFPFILLVIYRYRKHTIKPILYILAALSFILSALLINSHPNLVFYFLPTRGWELLCGSILALHIYQQQGQKTKLNQTVSTIISFSSLLMLIFPVWLYTNTTLFPAYGALPPCLGTILFIYLGYHKPDSWLIKIFSTKIMIGIGLISYSLYLWHWPIWAFIQQYYAVSISGTKLISYIKFNELDDISLFKIQIIALTLTFLCAYISYKFIELPFRKKTICTQQKKLFISLAIYGSALFIITFILYLPNTREKLLHNSGGSYLFGTDDQANNLAMKVLPQDFLTKGMPRLNNASSPVSRPVFIAIGDSHTNMYSELLQNFANEHNVNAQISGRIPIALKGLDEMSFAPATKFAYDYIAKLKPSHVLLSSNWAGSLPHGISIEKMKQAFINSIHELNKLGIHVWLISPLPIMNFDPPISLASAYKKGQNINEVGITYEEYLRKNEELRNLLTSLESDLVHIIDIATILCKNNFCGTADNDKSLYFDSAHLSNAGTEYVKSAFKDFFEAVKQDK